MRRLSDFIQNHDGTSTMMFGLIAVPLMAAVGMATDYSVAADARTKLQATVDATALKLTRGNNQLDASQLQSAANAMVRSLMSQRTDVLISSVTATRVGQRINVSAQGTVTARFSGMFTGTRTAIGATGQTAWGVRKLEVALVLDNTWSMNSSGKMTALKTAVTNFINTMQGVATEPDTVKISLVPFSTVVKVGTSYSNAAWLTKDYMPSWQRPSWDGCVMDRDQPNDVNDTAPVPGTIATLYPARMCPESTLAAVMPLTNNFDALRARTNSMTPGGSTNVTIGIAWGLATLSSQQPMTEGVDYTNTEVDKIMIVLTDGENTQNRWSSSASAIDLRTQAACNAVKANNIKVYTVRVIEGNGTLLRNCATSPSMYYDVSNASQLNPVFQSIADSIQKIRLTN